MVGNKLKQICKTWLAERAELAVTAAILGFVFFAPLGSRAAEEEILFRNQKIYTEGLSAKVWIGDPMAMDAELILIYSNAAPSAVNTLRTDLSIEARMLLVGGGGAGGYGTTGAGNPGGGGGGGQVLDLDNTGYSAGTYSITVGAGGAQTTAQSNGENGHPSVITNGADEVALALGGGGGGAKGDGNGTNIVGMVVATGGGGGGQIKSGVYGQGGLGTLFDGGKAVSNNRGGGGAGAGARGVDATATNAGNGGSGTNSTILVGFEDDARWFGGGGGGAQSSNNTAGYAGSGQHGGGHGGYSGVDGENGVDGTGGGGGGGGRRAATGGTFGGAGGSGLVIIRITFIEQPMKWKSVDVKIKGQATDGKIFIEETAGANWLPDGDLVLTFSNATTRGGLCFYDPEGRTEYQTLPPIWAKARILAVGGGGGGGFINERITTGTAGGAGGGGGAGGFLEEGGFVFSTNYEYSITVGAGGKAGTKNAEAGGDGGNSSVAVKGGALVMSAEAYGGGGGGAYSAGRPGASGGGGSKQGSTVQPGGEGVTGQGFHGGLSSLAFRGGGGGGAGAPGGDAVSEAGAGGAGTNSTITGSEKWYAGGGGGAMINANASTKTAGGAGGTGGGGAGAGAAAAQNGVNGTGGGGGGGVSYVNAPETAGSGGSGIVIIRLSGFVVRHVPYPEANGPFIYDGAEHRGVDEFYAYDLTGPQVAVNADVYTVRAYLKPGSPYTWAPGHSDGEPITWRIRQREVPVPQALTGFVYDGAEKVAVADLKTYDGVDYCVTSYVQGVELRYCSLSGHRETHAGSYKFTATLCNDTASTPNVTNFLWRYVETMEPQLIDWSIAQAKNEITSLTIDDWQEDTAGKSGQPTATAKFRNASDNIVYTYARSEKEPSHPADYDITEKPTEAGVYWVRAYLSKDSEHNPGDWLEASRTARFCIWRHPSKTLTDYVDITISGYSGGGTAVKDFPVLVRLKEAVDGGRGGGLPGFTYSRAGDGSEIRFVAISNIAASAVAPEDRDNPLARDSLLPYEVDTWNPDGESLVWVKIPSIANKTTKFRLYWHRNPDEEVYPDLLPTETWDDDYVGVWHLNKVVDGTLPNSTKFGGALDAAGEVDFVDSPLGLAAVTKAGDVQAPNYEPHMGAANSPFTFSAWYRGDKYAAAGYSMMCGKKGTNAYNWNGGWCWEMHKSKTAAYAYANNSAFTAKTVTDITKNWHHFSYNASKEGASVNHIVYADGAQVQSATKTTATNALPLTVIGDLFAGEEARLSKVQRNATWTKAEYESMNVTNYCTFSLVSTVDEEGRAWVNWWKKPPDIRRYWDLGTLTPAKVNAAHGTLYTGTITNIFTKMPDRTPVGFPDPMELAAYEVEFTMFDPEAGTAAYPGRHVLFGGSYVFDVEIVDHDPKPIDPGDVTASGRVLLANDDANEKEPVKGQAYDRIAAADGSVNPFWEHDSVPSPDPALRLRPGVKHTLNLIDGDETNALWTVTEAYLGSMLFTNETATLSNAWNELPPVSTGALTNDHIVLRNVQDARIESQFFTNGLGTVYFDVVNACAGTDVKAADNRLVVEVTTNDSAWAIWRTVPMTVLYWDGAKVTTNALSKTELDCLEVKNGGKLSPLKFYRVYAQVGEKAPARVRIRRTTVRSTSLNDDPTGFILIDGVTASWPALTPEIVPTGRYDETLVGKRVLGVEGAFTGGYPAAGDRFYANVRLAGGGVENVSSARMHYRWRYLGNRFDPARQDGRDVWSVQYLNVTNDAFSTLGPLDYNGRLGDIEYWFDLTAFVPYYDYVDHSGLGFGAGGYSEEPRKDKVSASQHGPYPSQGTNWFVRLREGVSPYRGIRAVLRRRDTPGAAPQTVDLALESDNFWRGYFRVREKVDAGWDCRFEAEEPGDLAAGTLTTNFWRASESPEKMPVSGLLDTAGGPDLWSVLPGEKATGYWMIQIDDKAKSLAVVHADYQNFNTWHDARRGPGAFTGTTNDVSGASAQVKDYDERFANWKDTVAENPLWRETFTDTTATQDGDYFKRGYNGVPLLTKFASATTLNNWSAGSAEYIPGLYQESRVQPGLSLQMDGRGGFIQFVDAGQSPRGLESVSFRARVAQSIGFGDFCYYLYGLGQQDYTFITYAAFDRNSNKDFSGNASLSVVAFYRPNTGCYEARWEQLKANDDFSGPKLNGQRLTLYRWSVNPNGVVTCATLGAITNTAFNIPQTTTSASSTYLPIYISAKDCTAEDDTTHIMVGVRRAGLTPSQGYGELKGQHFFSICYKDKDDASHKRLRAGSYGLLSANCRGVFLKPATTKSVAYPSGVTVGNNTPVAATDKEIDFSTNPGDYTDEKAHLMGDTWTREWTLPDSRMRVYGLTTDYLWGIEALDASAKLAVFTAPKGTANWSKEPLRTFAVSGFGAAGSAGTPYVHDIFSLDDCSVKIAAAGDEEDAGYDVVIDDVSMTQWRGEDYGDPGTWTTPDDGYGWRTNFIFSSGWIENHTVLLSAKRTKSGSNSALRSPLMDGKDGRGHGLGMIAFEYRDAQANARLLVDIATNLNAGTAKIDESQWVNWTNVDFSAMLPEDRLRGLQTFYLGLRDVSGMMRLRVDPAVIDAVAGETDRDRFGEVTVTRIFCRDEPGLDDESWWGWNLRTTDEPEEAYLADQGLDAKEKGLSYELNNSTTDGLSAEDQLTIGEHMPFVQTPTFGSDIVGEVSFRARKCDLDPYSQKAEIRVYGATSGQLEDDTKWTELGHVVVSNDQYVSYRLQVSGGYHAFRLGVTGVSGVNDGSRGPDPTEGRLPVRVLIEEVAVSQAVTPILGFRYIRPFRDGLDNDAVIPDILSCDQQPLLGESWSVQAEIEAKQLPEEIDFDTPGREPRVIFHWFAGMRPWGYDNWRDRGNVAELVRPEGEKMVFRGGFTLAPDAVVEPSAASTYAVVQYMAEIVYWSVGGKCKTNTLSESEWKRPDWYYPLDLNRENADWLSFSAYNVLEGIAPRRVWINEANLYDGLFGGLYPASTNQYIEVAAPMQQAIDGWRLEYIDNNFKTNALCTFGSDGVSSVKTMNATNEYVFFSVQSPKTRDAKTLNVSKGEVDGTWKDFNMSGGELTETLPIAIRLIRPSRIVAQEIVLEGTNTWAGSVWGADYSASNMVRRLNEYAVAADGEGKWYEAGNEYGGGRTDSLGVTNFIGEVKEDWSSPMRKSPGRANAGQIVPENYVIYPNGSLMVVYSSVDANGHVKQTFGSATNSTEAAIGIAMKGGDGTNITYQVDNWWEIKELTTNGVAVPGWAGKTGRQVFTAGKGESNSVYVVATAQPRADIRELIGPDNAYADAILDWLGGGKTMKGEFENPGEIQLGEYWPKIDDPKYRGRRKLNLTEEYWLDIDPTSSNWVLHAGFCNPMPHEVPMEDASRPNAIRMGIYMAITNVNPESEKFGFNWSPYVLRGLRPGENSQDYSQTSPNAWTSVTFKITGDIQNGMPLRKRWMPLRWFTFDASSFNPDHTAVIDILNPYDKASPAASYGWRDYIGTQVFYSWNIDTRLRPITVEVLRPESKLGKDD